MDNDRLFELRRRTFDTPHFRGIEFIESEAKTIINRVPRGMPFTWTINPYRGCSHACSYCLEPSTPVLMADGRTKPIAELHEGDEIYGTQRVGNYRRFVTTPVLAHWSTTKRAYRVALEDGTELVASADHRFLSNRGWKYVTGAYGGPNQRPHLTLNNHLLGTGRFAAPPDHDAEYQRGYLCGMIRGDGHVGSYSYPRPGRTSFDVHRFRLALKDLEPLRRTRSYLASVDIETDEFLFAKADGTHAEMLAIRTSAQAKVDAIRRLCEWPERPSESWMKGFLAGVFDAEGSYSRGIWRVSNTDASIVGRIREGLDAFGFRHQLERIERAKPMHVVRLLGGVREVLRWFHAVDPATTRKRSIEGQAIKNDARLRVVSISDTGVDIPMYDITTGTGDFIANGVVSHNCFARVTHTYMDMNAGRDFETKIVVKVNAPELLRKQLANPRWKGESIAMGTATDPYQRAEGRYQLMPKIIRALTEFRNPFSILTKGTLILRDIELLKEAAAVVDVSTALSIPTQDTEAWRRSEPGTPHPRKRIEAVARLNDAGIPCGVMIAPILPGITDSPEQLMDAVKAAVDAGATFVTPIFLHLRPVVREEYMAWLAGEYPGLVRRYEEMYADNAYGPKADRNALQQRVRGLVTAAGGLKPGTPGALPPVARPGTPIRSRRSPRSSSSHFCRPLVLSGQVHRPVSHRELERTAASGRRPGSSSSSPVARTRRSRHVAKLPTVSIVGAGRVGGAIGIALARAGYTITAAWSQLAHRTSARRTGCSTSPSSSPRRPPPPATSSSSPSPTTRSPRWPSGSPPASARASSSSTRAAARPSTCSIRCATAGVRTGCLHPLQTIAGRGARCGRTAGRGRRRHVPTTLSGWR